MGNMLRNGLIIYYLCLGCVLTAGLSAKGKIEFNRDIRPILSDKCFQCHGPDEQERKGDLRLDTREGALMNQAIVPGDIEKSEVVYRMTTDDENDIMPPKKSHLEMSKDEIDLIKQWIKEGAEYQAHWSFEAPTNEDKRPLREIIDGEIDGALKSAGMKALPKASKSALVRRLSLDLRGIPPTVEEVDAFLADAEAGAWERLVDGMLKSPQHAERLTLDWLDASRYADTNGYSIDDHREMWVWRDWVIHAFMNNKPYDQFIVEQLAGDLLPDATPMQKTATGFLRNSMNTHEGGTIPEEYRVAYIADKIDTVSSVFMGMTMKCAQCHDHKYDPISQKDYYRFFAFFNSATEHGKGATNGNTKPFIKVKSPLQQENQKVFEERIERIKHLRENLDKVHPERYHAWTVEVLGKPAKDSAEGVKAILQKPEQERSEEENKKVSEAYTKHSEPLRKRLNKSLGIELKHAEMQLKLGEEASVMIMDSPGKRKTHMLIRGEYNKPGEEVTAGVPELFPPLTEDAPVNRLGMAQWLISDTHPTTSRVIVNRYWQMLFGAGIVRTAEDFGSQGELPSHPELLDALAVRFREDGWDLRNLLKEIVMSEAYQRASKISKDQLEADPANRLLARAPRVRLSAELIRDNALYIAGLLNPYIGGPSVYPEQPDGLWRQVSHFGYGAFTSQAYYPDQGDQTLRRSMYTFWKRTAPPPSMAIFDAPTREVCTIRRMSTNTPLQALVLMNDPQYLKAAWGLGLRVMQEVEGAASDRIKHAFRIATSRQPSERELSILELAYERELKRLSENPDAARSLLEPFQSEDFSAEKAAYMIVASTILNLNETITRQ